MGIKRTTERLINDCNEAGGTVKLDPNDLSMVSPCFVKKVEDCEKTIAYTMLVAHIGNNLSTAFASSTSLLLQALLSSSELLVATKALSKNLLKEWKQESLYKHKFLGKGMLDYELIKSKRNCN